MRKYVTPLVILFLVVAGLAALIAIFALKGAVLDPKGAIGAQQKGLMVVITWLMLIVVIPVFLLTLFISGRYRGRGRYSPELGDHLVGELIWWGVPFGIVTIIGILTWIGTHRLDPYRPIEASRPPITIQVVALQWKWLFIYPEEGIATVAQVQFPVDTPVSFEITADAPMNSFWIPQLGGQIYAMPAMRSRLHLIADEVGDYRGSSANFSGEGFAGMTFVARASTTEDFESWVEEVRRSPRQLSRDSYRELAEPSSYVPVSLYSSVESGLFEQIVDQYGRHH